MYSWGLVMDWHPTQVEGEIPRPYVQCPENRLWIHHYPFLLYIKDSCLVH